MLREVYEAGGGIGGVLRLALSGPSAAGQFLPEIVREFEARHPGCVVEVSEVDGDDPLGPATPSTQAAIHT